MFAYKNKAFSKRLKSFNYLISFLTLITASARFFQIIATYNLHCKNFFPPNGCWIVVSEQLMNIECFFLPESQFKLMVDSLHICDCIDYYVYEMFKLNKHISLLNDQYCRVPENLYNVKVIRHLPKIIALLQLEIL